MLSVGNAGLGSGASLSLDVRAAVGAGALAANTNVSNAAAASSNAVTLSDQRAPAYNSIEFIYRQDYGKVILREQNATTGQEVTQIPSEYHLQQYAATQRAQRVQQQAALYHLEHVGGQPRSGVGTKTTAPGASGGKSAAPTSTGQSVPTPALAPAPAPAVAAPAAPVVTAAAAAPAPAHVDIKV
jgi:hypothetical protein